MAYLKDLVLIKLREDALSAHLNCPVLLRTGCALLHLRGSHRSAVTLSHLIDSSSYVSDLLRTALHLQLVSTLLFWLLNLIARNESADR